MQTNDSFPVINCCRVKDILASLGLFGSIKATHNGKFIQSAASTMIVALMNNCLTAFYIWSLWFVGKSIQILINDVKIGSSTIGRPFRHRVSRWKRLHSLISRQIQEIEGFFGPPTVLIFASIFVRTILMVYKLIADVITGSHADICVTFLRLSKDIVTMSALISGTEVLKNKVIFLKYNPSFHSISNWMLQQVSELLNELDKVKMAEESL